MLFKRVIMERKYAIQGIIGCLLSGIGDWLLGFVDPGKVDGGVFYFISAVHGADYADWKIVVTLVLAVIGALFFSQGCIHIAYYMTNEKDRAGARFKKREAFFTPLTWCAVIGLISIILPESAFSKGLYTFCMNGGMIIWFVRELIRKKGASV